MRKGWSLKSLDELFEIKSSKRVHKKDWKTNGIPFYRAREVVKLAQNGTVDNELFISEELYNEFTKEKKAPKEGDIIISAVGTLGQCYLVKKNDKFYFKDASVLWFEKISDVNERYIEFAFKSESIKKQVHDKSMGATVGTLTISRAKIIKIPIPSLEEQRTIVAKLDQAFAAIDQAKANIEKNIANAKELFQSKLNQIFSQKSEGWEEKRIKEIGKVQTGTTPPTKDKDNYGEFIPFIKPAHFNSDGSLTPLDSYLSEKGIKKSRLIEANSVLMVCIGATIGKTGFTEIDITCNQQINAVTPSKNYNYKFIYFGMISRIFQDEVLENGKGAQATLPIINKSKWENLFLNVNLNKDVQQQIVTQLDQLQEQTNILVAKYQQKLANLEELKKSILEKAFKGELV